MNEHKLPGKYRLTKAANGIVIMLFLVICIGCGQFEKPAADLDAEDDVDVSGLAEYRPAANILSVTMEHVAERLPHDPEAFVQGLFFDDGVFIESTGGYGRSSLCRVHPATGEVLAQYNLPPHVFGEGCAPVPGGKIVQLTWRNRLAYFYDAETLKPLSAVKYPREGWGLVFDGQNLLASDGSHKLYSLDPETLRTTDYIEVRTPDGRQLERLNEMAWVDGRILANVFLTNYIVQINPQTGEVERQWDLAAIVEAENPRHPEHVLNGIAYDPASGKMWITGKNWRYLYQVNLPGLDPRDAG